MNLIDQVEELFIQNKIDIFLGYKELDGHMLPHAFTRDKMEELKELQVSEDRYSLEKVATHLTEKNPDIKIGMIARECNLRTLNLLYTWKQLKPENIETINISCCPSPLNSHSDCSYLEPKQTGEYKKAHGIDFNTDPDTLVDKFDNKNRFSRWMYEFNKCIKCYGCRNICPVCFCAECSLEHASLVEPGTLPADVPIFHLIRATHMAGRCIDCGLCEDACPVDIPLRLLYREVNSIVSDIFDYQPGNGTDQSPFTIIGEKTVLELKPMDAQIEGEKEYGL